MNPPYEPDTHDGRQVVITTREFRMGQKAAWRDFEIDPDSTPNEELRERLGSEFWAGYVDEWENFCVPMRKVTPTTCPTEHLHDAMPCEDCDYLGE